MDEVIIYLVVFSIVIALFISYLVNIFRLVTSREVNGMTIARAIGIFVFPLGCLLGFIKNKQ